MDRATQALNAFFALVVVLAGAYLIYWAASRQSHQGRARGRHRRWKYVPALLALAALFAIWKAIETGALDIAAILTSK